MKKVTKQVLIGLFALIFMMQILAFANPSGNPVGSISNDDGSKGKIVDIGNNQSIEVGPDEQLHSFILTEDGWTEYSGTSSYLTGSEYGNSTTTISDTTMNYLPSNVTSDTYVNIATGAGWEGYETDVVFNNLYENRTWIQNPTFNQDASSWTITTYNTGGSSTPFSSWNSTGHGASDGCVDFEINSNSGSQPYYYDAGDRAYATQTTSINRGDVVWAGFRFDYWADTRDDTHYGMTGTFALYLNIESTSIWTVVFSDVGKEETWYDSGLVSVPTNTFNLPTDQNVNVEFGLESRASVGYAPNILPAAKFDNFILYMKTRATPTSINLEMDDIPVNNNPGYGSGYVSEVPTSPWLVNPIKLNFSWAPTPINPTPNLTITVEFDTTVNMFARKYNTRTVSAIDASAYGERFIVSNGTAVNYTTYFYANIPAGYVNRYYFNLTTPSDRDTYFIGKPLAPGTNLTTGWTGGQLGDGFVNISAYEIATAAGRYGYWRILSHGINMISDLEIYDPSSSSWQRTADLRAGNTSQVRVYVGTQFEDSIVNITILDPDGNTWLSVNATADATGYATSSAFVVDGATANAGDWMVIASTNDIGTNGIWRSTGFFKRPFTVTHTSELLMHYPADAIGTWTTNVTFGDLLLIILKANDTDSSMLVTGGTLDYSWSIGAGQFDDSGNGQYTKVIDTSTLTGKGQFTMTLTWSHPSYDTAQAFLMINVNYASTLTSPDYPGIAGPVGPSQEFIVRHANVNGTYIQGGIISSNWSRPYSITPLGLGRYRVSLDTDTLPIGQYVVEIYASASFVEQTSMIMYIEIREIYNTVSYSANQLSIPVGESDSFVITWTDTDTSTPITGGASYISCNWTSFHSSGEQNYTIVEETPGNYRVTIFTESDDPLTSGNEYFQVDFTIARANYQNHTFSIGVQIRSHNTLFILDSPVEQTEYGSDIIVQVYFEDTDIGVGIKNDTYYVSIDVASPGVTLYYTSIESGLGDGHYNISIPSNQWGTIGWKNLTITASWIGPVLKYYQGIINTQVRILGTETDLYLEQAPTATYYLDNFTFSAVYWDAINLTRISDPSNVFITITPVTSGHPVTQEDFMISESATTPGTYEFELDSSLFLSLGTFRFRLDLLWSEGVSPLYENQTMTFTLVVLARPTYIDFNPIQSTPFNETAELSFTFVDSLSAMKIQNSSSFLISINEGAVQYTTDYDSLGRLFYIYIDTESLGGTGSFQLHLNVTYLGIPFYTSHQNDAFTVTVEVRSTQLSHLSFAPVQFGNNATIEFVYTDLISQTSSGMIGTLTLNPELAGWYSVTQLGSGHYYVEIDTTGFGSDGIFAIIASITYTGTNHEDNATEAFGFTVQKRVTQLGYDSPDPAPYLTNVTFSISYTDDTTGQGISGAQVFVSCDTSDQILVNDSNYWYENPSEGVYIIYVDSVALGEPGTYSLNVTVTWTGTPFYEKASKFVSSRVIERTTQILITKTPGETEFLENITFTFRYEDFITGSSITIQKQHITLTFGPSSILIDQSNFSLSYAAPNYQISFSSTVLSETTLDSYTITITIDRSGSAPYYAIRSKSTIASVIERQTQILFPLVQDTPFGDNITINLDYVDYLTGNGIEDASISITSVNLTTPVYTLNDLGDGAYEILVPSVQFGSAGVLYFNFTISKIGPPFYSSRDASDVIAIIRLIQVSMTADTPAPGSIPIGAPMIVNLTLIDYDHGTRIGDALVYTDWEATQNRTYIVENLGNGNYRVTLNMSGLLAQEYTVHAWAVKTNYELEIITFTVQPGVATIEILLDRTTYYVDWGEDIIIQAEILDPFYGTGVPGMSVVLNWAGVDYPFEDNADGTYELDITSRLEDAGFYTPTISASYEFYQTRQKSFNLVVSRATGQIIPELSTVYVVIGTQTEFSVYLNDTISNLPVNGAVVEMEWNDQIIVMSYNGTPGFYNGTINVSGLAIGTYDLGLTGIATNHDFLKIVVDVVISPIPSKISLLSAESSPRPTFGDSFEVVIGFNDSYYLGSISNASVTYVFGPLSGSFTEKPDGSYSALIDTSTIGAQIVRLKITAMRTNYSTGSLSLVVTIRPIPTQVSVDDILRDGYHGDYITFTFRYTDTHSNVSINDATLFVDWSGGMYTITSLGNGYYEVEVNLNQTIPRFYELSVIFTKLDYTTVSIVPGIVLKPTPAEIIGPSSVSIPFRDSMNIEFRVNNTLTNQTVSDIVGTAFWATGSISELILNDGVFLLEIPDDIPMGIYTMDIVFEGILYSIPQESLEITIRPIQTELVSDQLQYTTQRGGAVVLRVSFIDTDHNTGITGVTPTVSFNEDNVIYYPEYTVDEDNNGTYLLYFTVIGANRFTITVGFEKEDHFTPTPLVFTINADITEEQRLQQVLGYGFGFGFLLIALLIGLYVRVWSVPKIIRALNRLISMLSKGRVPKPVETRDRSELIREFINDELKPVGIQKGPEDITGETIIIDVPEVDALLERLADITNLGAQELVAFRADLSRMPASERPGFLREVIQQEEARRAEMLAERDGVKKAVRDKDLLGAQPEELESIRKKLRQKGLADSEIEVIIEQAQNLSKADLEALLDSLGIRLD